MTKNNQVRCLLGTIPRQKIGSDDDLLGALLDAAGHRVGDARGCEFHVSRLHDGFSSGGAVEGDKLVQHGV